MRRSLHWVMKVGNLRRSIDFMTQVSRPNKFWTTDCRATSTCIFRKALHSLFSSRSLACGSCDTKNLTAAAKLRELISVLFSGHVAKCKIAAVLHRCLPDKLYTVHCRCNGPYGGRWSKTMVGYGPEHRNFALELTANYGVHEYDKQDDLRQIVVRSDIAGPRFAPFRRSR